MFKTVKQQAAKLSVQLQELAGEEVAGYMDGPVQKVAEELRLQLLTLQDLTASMLAKLPASAVSEEVEDVTVVEETAAGEVVKEPVPKRVSRKKSAAVEVPVAVKAASAKSKTAKKAEVAASSPSTKSPLGL